MYKSKVHQWQLDKKRKRPEMLFAQNIIERRRRQGLSTRVMIRGREITETEIRKYFKRQKKSLVADDSMNDTSHTPENLEYCTPVLKRVLLPGLPTVNAQTRASTLQPLSGNLDLFDSSSSEPCQQLEGSEECQTQGTGFFGSSWPVNAPYPRARAVRRISPNALTTKHDTFSGFRVATESILKTSKGLDSCSPELVGLFESGCDVLRLTDDSSTLFVCQAALHEVENYFKRYYFCSEQWVQFSANTLAQMDDEDNRVEPQECPCDRLNDPGHLASAVEVAVQLFSKDQVSNAGNLIGSVCENIRIFVREQHPQLLSSLLVSISLLGTTRFQELSQIILVHFRDFACLDFGPQHPLTLLSSLLAKACQSEKTIATLALDVLLEAFTAHAGDLHPARLQAMYIYAWATLRRRETAKARNMFERLQVIYETQTHPDSIESRKVLYSLAQVHIAQGNTGKAKEILEEHQRRTERRFGRDTPVESKIECLRVRALLCKKRREFGEMEEILSQAWKMGMQLLTTNHPTMLLLEQEMTERRMSFCTP